jgi:hypothetical protein
LREQILERLAESINPSLEITKGSIPIPFFGNFEKATSCTISINPSDNEFHKKKKGKFESFRNRLITRHVAIF